MAVVAASIAGFFVSRQLKEARVQHADKRWWESLQWVYEVVRDDKSSPSALGPEVGISLLLALQQEANSKHGTVLQRSTIGALASAFSRGSVPGEQEEVVAGAAEGVGSSEMKDSDPHASWDAAQQMASSLATSPGLSEALRSLLENASSASPQARARLFEIEVVDALSRSGLDATLITGGDPGFDIEVRTPDGVVGLEVKAWQAVPSMAETVKAMQRLQKAIISNGLDGGLVVFRDSERSGRALKLAEGLMPANIAVLFWDERDESSLQHAILEVARNRKP